MGHWQATYVWRWRFFFGPGQVSKRHSKGIFFNLTWAADTMYKHAITHLYWSSSGTIINESDQYRTSTEMF